MRAALPAHHHDHDGGHAGRAAAGAGNRRGRRNAASVGDRHRRRTVPEPVAHVVHNSSDVSLSGPLPLAVGSVSKAAPGSHAGSEASSSPCPCRSFAPVDQSCLAPEGRARQCGRSINVLWRTNLVQRGLARLVAAFTAASPAHLVTASPRARATPARRAARGRSTRGARRPRA